MELCDDMILWCSLQLPLLADWKNLARRLGVQSVIPIVRDVIESSEKVSTALEFSNCDINVHFYSKFLEKTF